MATTTLTPRPAPARLREGAAVDPHRLREPAYQAYVLLRVAFVVAPIAFGLDKFFNWMTDWPAYLWAGIPDHLPGTAQQIMYGVGAVEILAGLLVLALPRVAPYVVAAWLAGITANLVIVSAAGGSQNSVFWDVALRDFGLMLAAIALGRLAAAFSGRREVIR